MSSRDSQRRINILMLGMTSVGKTSLARLARGDNFSPDYRPTVHNDYDVSIRIRGLPYAVTITDTEGLQPQDDNVPDPMLMNKQGIILVYSIEDEQSFEILENAMNDIVNRMEIPMLLVGNKTDLPNRRIATSDGETLAQEFAIQHHETSARNLPNDTCPEIFKMLIDTILSDGRDHTVFLDQARLRKLEREGMLNHAQAAAQAQSQAQAQALAAATRQAQVPTTTQANPGHNAGASARGSTNPQAPAKTTSITSSNSHSALRDQPPTNSHPQGQRSRNHYEASQGVQNQRTQGRGDHPGSRARNENNNRGTGRQSSDRESEGTAANRRPGERNRGDGQEPPGGEYRECIIM